VPRSKNDSVTVAELCNRFLNAKQTLVDSGELKLRTWRDYREDCKRVARGFGRTRGASDIGPDDFKKMRADICKSRGPT
jgi:hypothetical protein